mmetsp:Transcript_13260/g.41883  ORF Transcript_13260/g.41883 Transcript_13260/m.41883 type:complete len:624 (+) Transcript_13260:90-1961(+)
MTVLRQTSFTSEPGLPRAPRPPILAFSELSDPPALGAAVAEPRREEAAAGEQADGPPAPRRGMPLAKRVTLQDLCSRTTAPDWRTVKVDKRLTCKEVLEVEKLQRDPWVLTPQAHPMLQWWDLGTMVALCFVALVTPAEVALLETHIDALFFVNRLIDAVFVFDMALQFCVAYNVKTPYGSRLETRRHIIVRHYLRTWFALDVVSVLPFDSVGMIVSNDSLARAKMMKVFIIASHWLACVWAMLAFQGSEGEGTWVDHAAPKEGTPPSEPLEVYIAALYWSVMTVTSVGYGDIVPVTTWERVFCTLLMFCSGFLWAYALGETMAALGNSNVHETNFRHMLDDLNHMMADRGLPRQLQRRLRSFFFQIKDLARVQGYKALVEQLSPSLQGELAMTVNEVWMSKVWYFNSASLPMPPGFLSAIAQQLQVSVHAQQESIGELWTLYILHRGLAVRKMGILHSGSVWGEDFVLASRELLDSSQAFCLTFIELSRLTRRRFTEIVKHFPQVWKPLRVAVVRTAVRRGILLQAARKQRDAPRKRFMAFAKQHTLQSVDRASMEADFPLPSMIEESMEVSERLHDVAVKQAQMQVQLDATRSSLTEQLLRIEDQLKSLLPSGPAARGGFA